MKTWFRLLMWRLLSAPIIRAVAWTDEERRTFDAFVRSSAGQKLFELLRQTVASVTFHAVFRNSVSANAHARGMQDLLGLIHRLREFPPEAGVFAGDDVEPLPSQRGVFDGRRFVFGSGGNSAIGSN